MLVLSRRVQDSIVFPDLGISVDVLAVKGKSVRIGVDAPIEVRILRGELFDSDQEFRLKASSEHEIRNKLNSLTIAAAYAKLLIERGQVELATCKLQQVLAELQEDSQSTQEQIPIENDRVLTALLVEDVDNERELLSGILKLHGMHVVSVPDAETAIEYLEDNSKPDFIMVDIGLPRTSGSELIVQIRSNPAFNEITLYAISGKSPEQAKINPSSNRIQKWFQKPLEPSLLISEIENSVSPLAVPISQN